MKPIGFFEGVGLGLLASIAGSAAIATLSTLFASYGVFRVVVAALSLAYVLYLLIRSKERVGRVIVISSWLGVAVFAWTFVDSLLLYLVIHLCLIWLVRSLYFYSSIVSALSDLALCGLSLMISLGAWNQTHSLFLSLWCFFLIQALFVLIPKQIAANRNSRLEQIEADDSFERAHRVAEAALRKLTTTHLS